MRANFLAPLSGIPSRLTSRNCNTTAASTTISDVQPTSRYPLISDKAVVAVSWRGSGGSWRRFCKTHASATTMPRAPRNWARLLVVPTRQPALVALSAWPLS